MFKKAQDYSLCKTYLIEFPDDEYEINHHCVYDFQIEQILKISNQSENKKKLTLYNSGSI